MFTSVGPPLFSNPFSQQQNVLRHRHHNNKHRRYLSTPNMSLQNWTKSTKPQQQLQPFPQLLAQEIPPQQRLVATTSGFCDITNLIGFSETLYSKQRQGTIQLGCVKNNGQRRLQTQSLEKTSKSQRDSQLENYLAFVHRERTLNQSIATQKWRPSLKENAGKSQSSISLIPKLRLQKENNKPSRFRRQIADRKSDKKGPVESLKVAQSIAQSQATLETQGDEKKDGRKTRSKKEILQIIQRFDLEYYVKKVVSCYGYFQNYGYSGSKITALVKNCCKFSKQLVSIFLKIKKYSLLTDSVEYEHKTTAEEIMESLILTLTHKLLTNRAISQLAIRLVELQTSLEREVIRKGSEKIKDTGAGIISQNHKIIQDASKIKEEDLRFMWARTPLAYSRKIIHNDIGYSLKQIQSKFGTSKFISNVNREIYSFLSQQQNRVLEAVSDS